MRKHHNLDFVGKIVTRSIRTTVEMEPTGENADRYSVLSTSWGKMINNEKVLEAVEDPCDGESEDEPIPGSRMAYNLLHFVRQVELYALGINPKWDALAYEDEVSRVFEYRNDYLTPV